MATTNARKGKAPQKAPQKAPLKGPQGAAKPPKGAARGRKAPPAAKPPGGRPAGRKAPRRPAAPRRVRCEECMQLKDPSVIVDVEGAMVCKVCKHTVLAEVKPAGVKAAGMQWFAVATVSQREVKARKEMLKRARDMGLMDKVGRVLIPTHVEVLTRGATYEVWSADAADPEAKKLGFISGPDDIGDALFEAIHKWPNEATLEVRSIKKGGRVVARNKRSFPGMLIVQCRYDADLFHLIDGTPGVFGVLPLRPPLKGFRYPPKEPRQARKPTAKEIEAYFEWSPVPLSEDEVKRLLAGATAARKPVREQVPALDYGVGDKVRLLGGLFKGMTGKVLNISGAATDPDVTVEVKVMGREVDTVVKHWHAKRGQ